MASGDRRVVISGLGPVSAAGVGMDPLWEAMCAGTSAISRIERFDATGFPSQHGGEVSAEAFKIRDVVPKSYRKATKVMARDIELAVAAAATAIAHAKIETKATSDGEPTIPAARMGCHIGAGFVAADIDELTTAMWQSRDDDGEGASAAQARGRGRGARGCRGVTPGPPPPPEVSNFRAKRERSLTRPSRAPCSARGRGRPCARGGPR